MNPTSQRIPTSEWERHKDQILEIYQHKTLREVQPEMKTKHGFDASSSKYEAQLKRWNIRKYATQKEWQRYFAAGQNPSIPTSNGLPGDSTVPEFIRKKSQGSKKRASRWASTSLPPGGAPSASERRGPAWTLIAPRLTPVSTLDEPIGTLEVTQSGVKNALLNLADTLELRGSSSVDDAPSTINGFQPNHNPWNVSRESSDITDVPAYQIDPYLLSLPTELLPTPTDFPITSLQQYASDPSSSQFGCLPVKHNIIASVLESMNLNRGLPFAHLDYELRHKWNIKFGAASKDALGEFAFKVVTEILLSKHHSMAQKGPHMKNLLCHLGSQVPGERSALITDDQAFESKFSRALLCSVLNGFSGLDGVPIDNILRFLNRFAVNKLLLDILEQCPRYVSRTLADNIFRGAIEAADIKVVHLLINRTLVDVNETVCVVDGRKYTPIERAATLRCPALMKTLIKAGADVNKSHPNSGRSRDGALEALFTRLAYRDRRDLIQTPSPVTPEAFEAFHLLVNAGARVHARMANVSGPGSVELRFLISQNIAPDSHWDFFIGTSLCECPLESCVAVFDDRRAAQLVRHVINLCQEANCGQCLTNFSPQLEQMVVRAASAGKVELVKLLLNEADLKSHLPQIFIAAIESQSHALIEYILSQGPVLNPPAETRDRVSYTPISEAVKYGNADLMQRLEAAGCLDQLTEGGRYDALFNATIESGNTAVFKMIIARAVTSKQAYRGTRSHLALAMKHGHNTMRVILEAGASNRAPMFGQYGRLSAATNEMDLPMLRDFIAAGARFDEISLFADHLPQPMIEVMIQEYPEPDEINFRRGDHILPSLLRNCIERETVDFLKGIFDTLCIDCNDIDSCLQLAVELGHEDLIGFFLDIGGNPFNNRVLQAVVPHRPDILRLLIQRENRRQTIPKCVGASVLEPILGNNPGDAEALEELIRTGAINLKRLEYLRRDYAGSDASIQETRLHHMAFTPLGLAIQSGTPGAKLVAMKRFLEAGADPNGISKSNSERRTGSHPPLMTALMVAVEVGSEDAVNMLLDYNADINAQPRIRITRTALQYAAELGKADMVRLLVSRGADVNSSAAPYGGATAVQFTAMSGNCNIVAELLDRGADLNALPSKIDGMWPLEGAAARGRLDMISFLWELNRSAAMAGFPYEGFADKQCLRAMWFARAEGHIGCGDLISELSGISIDRLETDEYGAPWIAY